MKQQDIEEINIIARTKKTPITKRNWREIH